jgi:putative ABC transport system permease protein
MLGNALLLALRAIRRNVLRSFLTILGIVIGVASVITMVNLGRAATVQVSEQIASLGSNLLMLRPGQRLAPGQRSAAPAFDIRDAQAIERDVGGVAAVAATASKGALAVFGNVNWSTVVTGVDNNFFAVRDWPVARGREFTQTELRAGKPVCIIGATVRTQLFGNQDPIGTHIRLKNISCEVIGLLETKGQASMGTDRDDVVLVPLRMFWRRIAGNQDVDLIQISARTYASTSRVQRDVEELMRERRHMAKGEENDFTVLDMKQIADTLTGTTTVLTGLLGAVAAVSLLVGGIGIMNIMLVSVTERTREIGVRLAVGALGRDVLLQFLVESVVLSCFGGLFGIILALLASLGISRLLGMPFIVDPAIVVIAFVFAAAVGVVFGFFPARRAANLDPIDALRHE